VEQCVTAINVALDAAWNRFIIDRRSAGQRRILKLYYVTLSRLSSIALTKGVNCVLQILKDAANEARLCAFEARKPVFNKVLEFLNLIPWNEHRLLQFSYLGRALPLGT